MKRCFSCGHELPDEARFCELCGQPQPLNPVPVVPPEPVEEQHAAPKKNRLVVLLVVAGLATLLMITCIVVVIAMMNGTFNGQGGTAVPPTTQSTFPPRTTRPTTTTTEQTTVIITEPTMPPTTKPTNPPRTTIASTFIPVDYHDPVEYVVTSSDGYVNLRRGPSTDYKIIREIPVGTRISVSSREGDWVYATYLAGESGWVHISGIETQDLMTSIWYPKSYMFISSTDYVVDSWDGVNLRYGPSSTQYAIIETIPDGAQIVVTAVNESWLYCSYNGRRGWVHEDFVRPLE